jgi:hypothetical protein
MNSEFEDKLGRLKIRPIPSEWRDEILRIAQRPVPNQTPAPWWREWLWPCPQAWAGLAAAWVLVFLFEVTMPENAGSSKGTTPSTWGSLVLLEQQPELARQWSDPVEPSVPKPPVPAALQPRTSRRGIVNIG